MQDQANYKEHQRKTKDNANNMKEIQWNTQENEEIGTARKELSKPKKRKENQRTTRNIPVLANFKPRFPWNRLDNGPTFVVQVFPTRLLGIFFRLFPPKILLFDGRSVTLYCIPKANDCLHGGCGRWVLKCLEVGCFQYSPLGLLAAHPALKPWGKTEGLEIESLLCVGAPR